MTIRSTGWCAGMLLLIGSLTTAEAAGPLTQVGSWMSVGSPTHDLVIKDNLAYVVTDIGLRVFDLSNLPADPAPRGSIALRGRGLGIALNGSHVYVANQSRDLQIVDVSNPDSLVLVSTKTLPGYAWDVALKDDRATGGPLIAYVASFSGELYLIDVTDPSRPQQIQVLGLWPWSNPKLDDKLLAKLNSYVTGGSAKITGVTVEGHMLMSFDWTWGRAFFYDVSQADNPIFAGTHYAPFTFRGEIDLDSPHGPTAYILSAYASFSGLYSFPLSLLTPFDSTYHATCAACDFFAAPPTDNGGMALSASGKYAMYIAGKRPVIQVVDISDPTDLKDAGSVPIPPHRARNAQSMGVAQHGDYIIVAGAYLGLGVFHYPGLSN